MKNVYYLASTVWKGAYEMARHNADITWEHAYKQDYAFDMEKTSIESIPEELKFRAINGYNRSSCKAYRPHGNV